MIKVQRSTIGSQLPKGYKQTEAGVIPEDWEAGVLDKYWSVIDCKHVTAKFIRNGIPVASIREVQSRFVNLDSANQTTEIFYKQLIEGGRKPQCGDLILSRNATVGEIAQVADWHPFFAMGQDVCLLRKRSTNFSTSLVQAIIQSWIVRQQLENCMVGSTFRRVNVEQIKNLIIPLPPTKTEQEAIAHALSDIDALIESLDRLLIKKRQIKQGAIQELMSGKLRVAGFSDNQVYKETEIGIVPEDWGIVKLEKISAFITKGTTPTTCGFRWAEEGILFLRSECVSAHGLDLSQSMFISPEAHAVLNRSHLTAGDILITITGNVGRIVYLDQSFEAGNMNQHIARIRVVNSAISPKFIYHFLNQSSVRKAFNTITTGQAYPQLSLKQVRDATIPLPSLTEQIEIATILSDMDAEIDSIEAKLTKTRQIKQGMMHELLTGRIRLV
jgi:type I restriction enzyme, S subunit